MKKLLLAMTISLSTTAAFAAGSLGTLEGQCNVRQGSVTERIKFKVDSSEEGYVSRIISNDGNDYRIYVTNTAGLDLTYENNLIDITITPIRYFENPPDLEEEVEVDNSRTFQNPPDLKEVNAYVFPVSGREQIKDPKNKDVLYLNLYNGRIDFSCQAKFTAK